MIQQREQVRNTHADLQGKPITNIQGNKHSMNMFRYVYKWFVSIVSNLIKKNDKEYAEIEIVLPHHKDGSRYICKIDVTI